MYKLTITLRFSNKEEMTNFRGKFFKWMFHNMEHLGFNISAKEIK